VKVAFPNYQLLFRNRSAYWEYGSMIVQASIRSLKCAPSEERADKTWRYIVMMELGATLLLLSGLGTQAAAQSISGSSLIGRSECRFSIFPASWLAE
jgi:hypothetical protein